MKRKKSVAIIHTRLKCIDGVSIEAEKWIKAYQDWGYNVYLIAGRIGEKTSLPKCIIPEMDFTNPIVRNIKKLAFESELKGASKAALNSLIRIIAKKIKREIKNYITKNNIDFLSIENALSIPLNIPCGVALKELAEELNISVIARHHDLYWERPYFCEHNNIPKTLNSAFPPNLNNVVHVTISNLAKNNLKRKRNIKAITISNVIDFKTLGKKDDYNKDFRKEFGIKKDQILFLQPTRIVKRKAIERSIEFVNLMNKKLKKENVLMITGPSFYGDMPYYEKILQKMQELNVKIIFAHDRIDIKRKKTKNRKIYSITDAYVNADIITLPSDIEGFGNPVLEACAYKKPLFVNKYPVLNEMMKNKFDFITIDKKITKKTIDRTYEIFKNPRKRVRMVNKNNKIAKEHYSIDMLEREIIKILRKIRRRLRNKEK